MKTITVYNEYGREEWRETETGLEFVQVLEVYGDRSEPHITH